MVYKMCIHIYVCVLYGSSLYSHCTGSLAKRQDIMNALKGMHLYIYIHIHTYIDLLLYIFKL